MVKELLQWEPNSIIEVDTIDPRRVSLLADILGVDETPERLPPLWHWIAFLQSARGSLIGPDGHPRRGDFLPPLTERRRMFAGARLTFHSGVSAGRELRRLGTVTSVTPKNGKAGPFTLVSVRYEISDDGEALITESQDLIYTNGRPAESGTAVSSRPDRPWLAELEVDEVNLFKFSAVTFNAHRIHYDLRYAREVEGYPDLVVHGPLLALLLAELARKHAASDMIEFSCRVRAPIFVNERIQLEGEPSTTTEAKLFAYGPKGHLAVEATASFR